MKRIGTISSALGLIFLGAWMIISKNNSGLGEEVIKWWPIIIIILGVEILTHFTFKADTRVGFNFLIIPVVIIFIFINIFQGIYMRISNFNLPRDFGELVRFTEGFDFDKYEALSLEKVLPLNGDKLYLSAENYRVNIFKSNDGNIKLNTKVYANKSDLKDYKLEEIKEKDGYSINLNDGNIKRVEMDVYIPDSISLVLDSNNLSVKSEDSVKMNIINIKCNNGSVKLDNTNKLDLNINNGSVKLEDIKDIKVNGSNCTIDLEGDSPNIDIDINNGKIDVDSKTVRNINIAVHIGSVDIDTDDPNVSLEVDLDRGAAKVNGEKSINSGIKRSYGKGTNPVKIKINQGAVNFSSQE